MKLPRHLRWFCVALGLGLAGAIVGSLLDPQQAAHFMAIYSMVSWCAAAVLLLRDGILLERYAREKCPEMWPESNAPRFGPFAAQRHLRSLENMGDSRLATLARNVRLTSRLPFVLMLHYPLVIGWGFYFQIER